MRVSAVNRRAGACVALLGVAVCCLAPASLRAQRYSRPIEFSGPVNRTLGTNLNAAKLQSPEDRTPWLKLEEAPFHAEDLFNSGDSLQGVMAPVYLTPALSPAQRKRLKDQADRRKNWEFAQPEDAADVPKAEDMLNQPEYDASGRDKKSISVVERYMERVDPSRKQASERGTAAGRSRDNQESSLLDSRLRRDLRPSDSNIGDRLFGSTGTDPVSPLSGLDNNDSVMLFERTRTLKARLSEFNQLLGSGPPPGSANGTDGGFTPSAATSQFQPAFTLPTAAGFGAPGAGGLAGPAPLAPPTVNAPPFGQSLPALNSPPAAPASSFTPPTYSVPVRKF